MGEQRPTSPDDWDAHWEHYADSAAENPAQRMRHDIIARLLCEDSGEREMRVIDLGSGQGDLIQRLKSLLPGARFVGVELSESGVAVSQRKAPGESFFVADLLQSPPALNEFVGWATHAVCSEVLEHVDDPVEFLQRSRKYLAPDARLIVTVPAGPMSSFDRHIGHRQHFDREKVRSILQEAGYSVERAFLAGFPFFNLYRLLVIARGKRLATDIESKSSGITSGLARVAMKLFGVMFHANLPDSPLGWQLIAIARKASS